MFALRVSAIIKPAASSAPEFMRFPEESLAMDCVKDWLVLDN
jgi:hypothetical protein